MSNWGEIEVRLRRAEELRREADQARLARLAMNGQETNLRFFWRMIDRLGGWLVETGCRLQTRVDSIRQLAYPAPAPNAATGRSPCDKG